MTRTLISNPPAIGDIIVGSLSRQQAYLVTAVSYDEESQDYLLSLRYIGEIHGFGSYIDLPVEEARTQQWFSIMKPWVISF